VTLRWVAVGLVAAALAVGGWLVLFSPLLVVQTVTVVGEDRLSERAVLNAAQVPVGTPLARLDVEALARRLEELPAVAEATVVRDWPDGVRLELTERRSLGVVPTTDGYGVLGSDGEVFLEVDGPQRGLPLLAVSPLAPEAAVPGTPAVTAAVEVMRALPPTLARKVATVQPRDSTDVVLELRNGAVVRWGSAAASERKAQVLLLLLDRRAPGQRPAGYDVSAPETPVTFG
jgi:cell division protein FtsQ